MIPDLSLFYMGIYGGFGYDWGGLCTAYLSIAAGIPQAGNPAYTVSDFLAEYPQFAGKPTAALAQLVATLNTANVPSAAGMNLGQLITGQGVQPGTVLTGVATAPVDFTADVHAGDLVLTNVSSVVGLRIGQPISGDGIAAKVTIAAVGSSTVTLSAPAVADGMSFAMEATATTLTLSLAATATGAFALAVYQAPPVALAVIQLYINLATASLMSSRWHEQWAIAMGWYVAHFLTLYLQAKGNGGTTPGAIASAGLERGITISKSADRLSMGMQTLKQLDSWAAWTKTSFGTLLATFGEVVGAGPIYVR